MRLVTIFSFANLSVGQFFYYYFFLLISSNLIIQLASQNLKLKKKHKKLDIYKSISLNLNTLFLLLLNLISLILMNKYIFICYLKF